MHRSLLAISVGLVLTVNFLLSEISLADSGDLSINPGDVYFSDNTIVHNQTVRIYATVNNNNPNQDLLGSVQFKNQTTGNQIGNDQPISVRADSTDSVFVDWRPSAGTYTIVVTVYPWEPASDNSQNNNVSLTTTVDYDNDNDGVGNAQDPDDDNDDVSDKEDLFPFDATESQDTDEDGLGNNADPDDDNDGVPDEQDALQQDPTESLDTDEDGIGNNIDEDDDNDALSDEYEQSTSATDPLNPDTDSDGYNDGEDVFPIDETEWKDTDNDGVGNNADNDADNDGLADEEDEYPENHGPVIVLEQYEEEDPETGETYYVYDASKSIDPDGQVERMRFEWYTKEGRLIGETSILKLIVPFKNILPSALMVFDEEGESRSYILDLSALSYAKIIGGIFFFCLLVTLALIFYFKYTATARKNKPKKQVKKGKIKSKTA